MTSTRFNVGMSLDRSSSKTNKDDKDNSTSSDGESDEDYVPSAKELRGDVGVDDDENLSEASSDEDPDAENVDSTRIRKRGRKSSRPSHKRMKVAVETVEEGSPQQPSTNIDDVWNEFKQECDMTSKAGKSTSVVGNDGDGNEPKHSSAKTSGQKETTAEAERTNAVVERFEFAGEIIEKGSASVEPTVYARSELSPSSTGHGTGTSVAPIVRASGSRGAAGGGLSSALGTLNKKNKLSILEKSKMDWDNFKQKEGIIEELRTHNKGKDGYLEKQDFLQRTDLRQFEIEKAMRSSRRLK